jgi:hypothetical protein
MEPKISCCSKPAFRRQTSSFWHDQLSRSPQRKEECGLAPGLFLLDKNQPVAISLVGADWMIHKRKWLSFNILRQSEMGFVAKACYCRRIARHKGFLNDEQKKQLRNPQFAEVKAGEAIFHHSLTLHGSGENKSDKPRRAFVINVFARWSCLRFG